MLQVILLMVSLASSALCAPQADLIKILPGLHKQPSFKQYSGYLVASPTARLHYWFVESQKNPKSDPVVLWMNGGPGCSSLDGLLTEHGPFIVQPEGFLTYNNLSWNMQANMLYLEAPAGVGFSYSTDKNVTTDDDLTSLNNYRAIVHFFAKFPEYLGNDFYVTGESYGGIYVPTLAARLMQNASIHFKGFAVGNGMSSFTLNDNSLMYFGKYHGLFGEKLWKGMLAKCCPKLGVEPCMFSTSKDAQCLRLVAEANQIISYGLDIYNLYAPCAGGVKDTTLRFRPNRPSRRRVDKNLLFKTVPQLVQNNVGNDPECVDSSASRSYLNDPRTRYALNIPTTVHTWDICSEAVEKAYKIIYRDMTPVYKKLLAAKKYRILIYNGDVDMACNFLGDQWFLERLNMAVAKERHAWLYKSKDGTMQIGGYSKAWKEGITFVTVKGAGHMVPTDKPIQAYDMFSRFLTGAAF